MAPPPSLLHGPILPTLLRLAAPNVLAMVAAALVGVGETVYVGLLGRTPLAAMAVVFPFVMLMQMMSAGAMGGGVSSAISRALGAGDAQRARVLALHAICIAGVLGIAFSIAFWIGGPALYTALGAQDGVLREAVRYSHWAFAAALPVWLFNTLISVVRGGGNMRIPSLAILAVLLLQLAAGAVLGLGLAGAPRLGMQGIALGQLIAYVLGTAALVALLRAPGARVPLHWRGIALEWPLFRDILRVGAVSCLSPLLTVLTILVFTGLLAREGEAVLAGYGIGVRLEFMLIPIAFGVGVASVPMVGMAIGAGDVARARRVAWTAALLSAALLSAIGLFVAVFPGVWANVFSRDAGVLAHAESYLRWAGPAFGFFGLGLTLYFGSQGAGRVAAPVAAALLRFLFVLVVGHLVARQGLGPWALFAVVGAAMVVYGLSAAGGVWRSNWRATTLPAAVRPAT